jgi:hypothetical protein
MPARCDQVATNIPAGAPFWASVRIFHDVPLAAEKTRALAYLAIARGAQGLIFFSDADLQAVERDNAVRLLPRLKATSV